MRVSSRKNKNTYVVRRNKENENARMRAYADAFQKHAKQKQEGNK